MTVTLLGMTTLPSWSGCIKHRSAAAATTEQAFEQVGDVDPFRPAGVGMEAALPAPEPAAPWASAAAAASALIIVSIPIAIVVFVVSVIGQSVYRLTVWDV